MTSKKDNIEDELAELEAEIDKEEEKKDEELQNKPDLYPDNIEDKYHNIERMVSLGVLEKEKLMCFKIIKYKKKAKKDFFYWETKKKNINKKVKSITSLIEKKTWNIHTYQEKIKEQKEGEEKLLALVAQEPNLNEEQKEILKERINERKNIIQEELNQKVEVEEEEINENLDDLNIAETENIDLYPNTIEDIYHNIGKIDSLGALEKEKELSDKIIEYKKERNLEYNIWETKKENIDKKINSITNLVQNGTWDLEKYKSKIQEEKDWEQKLLELAKNDSSLNDAQKKIIKIRINERKKSIVDELNRNPEEEE